MNPIKVSLSYGTNCYDNIGYEFIAKNEVVEEMLKTEQPKVVFKTTSQ